MKTVVVFAFILLLTLYSCKKGGGGDTPSNTPDPSITVDDLSLFEGNGGTNTFSIVVRLSAKSTKKITVQYSTVAGTAKAVEDYTEQQNQTLTFEAGETQKTIALVVVADDIKEGDDELTIQLAAPLNATLSKSSAAIIIRNDDTKVPFSNTGYDAPTSYAGYNLVWSDEFNSGALDATAWTNQNGDGCSLGMCGWGNNELEYYTDRSSNLFFQDGKLIIEARKEAFNTRNYTSSKLISSGKKKFKYGRVDIRAKLPIGKGIWPAFWMLPQDNIYGGWPTSGEIDIMEMVGHDPARTHGTLHFGPGPGSTSINRNIALTGGTLNDQFHVYSIEWKQDQIVWSLDGTPFSTINKTDIPSNMIWPFNEDFFFIINLAVGGNWPGSPDANTYFPQWLIVDYIRVYQQP